MDSCEDCGLALGWSGAAEHDCPVRWRQQQERYVATIEARRIETFERAVMGWLDTIPTTED